MQKIYFPLWVFEGRPRKDKNCCHMGCIGCPILQVAQKAIVKYNFLALNAKVTTYGIDCCPKFATGLNVKINIDQKIYE